LKSPHILLGVLVWTILVGCRSGHFEGKAFNQEGQGFQVIPLSSTQLGTCSSGPEDCRTIQIELNILGPNREPLRDQNFEFAVQHPDFVSISPTHALTDTLGRVKLQLSYKVRPTEAPAIARSLFVIQSDHFGAHRYAISVNARREVDPLSQFEELQTEFKPQTLVVEEHLVSQPLSVATIRTVEKNIQEVEYTVEHIAAIGTLNESRIRGRTVFYEIAFPKSNLPPISGSKATNELGELSLSFPLVQEPFENERNFEIKISVGLSTPAGSEKTEWYLTLNFERDANKPLIAYSRTPAPTSDAPPEPQRIVLGKPTKIEQEDLKTSYEIAPDLTLKFIPQLQLKAPLFLSRKLIGNPEIGLKKLAHAQVCGKIFGVRDGNDFFEVISEDNVDVEINGLGEAQFILNPRFQYPEMKNITWVIALELPKFPKVEKSLFKFNPATASVDDWSMTDATQKLKDKIYELSCTPKSPEKFEGEMMTIRKVLPKAVISTSMPADFENYLQRVIGTREHAAWKHLAELVFKKNVDLAKIQVEQFDLIRELTSSTLLNDHPPKNSIDVNSYRQDYKFRIVGRSERCFSFSESDDPIVFCLSRPVNFENEETWSYTVRADSVTMQGPPKGVIRRKIFPF
jgi:hypothetical protein